MPDLALEAGLEDDLVVAPYATMLALMVDPRSRLDNLKRLENLGLMARWASTNPSISARKQQRRASRGVVIYAYMAHHQGMSLLALDNVLHREAMQRRFHGDAAHPRR